MPDFTEVAPRVWVAHHDWMHVNITLVGGSDGLVVVDTHGSAEVARTIVDDVRRLGVGTPTAIVNTHAHWDHWFGNDVLVRAFGDVPIHATEVAMAEMVAAGDRPSPEPFADHPRGTEILQTTLRPPDRGFSSALALDLGDRAVELVHPGRGHTAGDLVVRVPDADVLVGGDLVEESDKPFVGDDSYPLDWPLTLDLVLSLTTADTVVIPGHGALVDRDYVLEQRGELGVIAETIRHLASNGVPVGEALEQGEWPWPRELLRSAVSRGYEHLPRSQKRLPLV